MGYGVAMEGRTSGRVVDELDKVLGCFVSAHRRHCGGARRGERAGREVRIERRGSGGGGAWAVDHEED